MALIVADRVQETSTTTGSGPLTLLGATVGYRAASAVCVNGDTFTYYAEAIDLSGRPTGDWETGLGTWSTGNILTRTTVYASSNANAAVSWVAGTRRIGLGLVSTTALGPTTVVGNISATNLSGTNTGDQTSVTGTSGSTVAAVTFNTTGGAAAGTSFNGSVARTIDYSTVGAAASSHTHSYQAADGDLLAIGGLVGTSGLLRKTAADTWTLDIAAYSTTVGTVTSVAALTVGTTGTDISSTVATGTTTPVITLNIPTASAANRGALSTTDWTTFNNKTSNTGTVTSVATGNGMNFTTFTTSGTVTLGTPTTCTNATTNTVTANSHTHAITGFLTAEADTLATVTSRGDLATGNIIIPSSYAYGFWGGTLYSIAMGVGAAYQYGPVTDYSIKMNMSNGAGRGITFGQVGVVPVAAINTTSGDMTIAGAFSAASKSFLIKHPTKEGMKLRYGSLESPYHGVRLTGEGEVIKGKCRIDLPDYIHGLCKQEGSQVQITNIKHGKVIWVEDVVVDKDYFTVACKPSMFDRKTYKFYWSFTAVRKDIDDLEVECV